MREFYLLEPARGMAGQLRRLHCPESRASQSDLGNNFSPATGPARLITRVSAWPRARPPSAMTSMSLRDTTDFAISTAGQQFS
jgi:hypothetical protein